MSLQVAARLVGCGWNRQAAELLQGHNKYQYELWKGWKSLGMCYAPAARSRTALLGGLSHHQDTAFNF